MKPLNRPRLRPRPPPDIPVGTVIRLAPVVDEHGVLFAYFIIDDATGEALDLVSAECVRAWRGKVIATAK